MKKYLIIVGVITIGFIGFIGYQNIDYIKLKKIGYSNTEISYFNEKLTDKEINIIINNNYISNLKKFVENQEFKKDNLNKYISYTFKYNNISPNEIISICNNNLDNLDYNENLFEFINHENTNIDNITRYIEYQNKYNTNIDNTIWLVNNNIDLETDDYNKLVVNLMNEKYFINNNLKRYINYYNTNNNFEYADIISNVNSNLDYEYYTNIEASDLSKGKLLIVNKYYALDSNYIPDNLVAVESGYGIGYLEKETYEQFVLMAKAARMEGLTILSCSPYRSYATQKYIYNDYVKRNGQEEADTYSARPGHSEHQTGLAVDIKNNLNSNLMDFENTQEAKWLIENAYKFGFILRYPEGKERITGYIYEPWHYRYVGLEVAKKIQEEKITYEEYYAYYIKNNP